MAERVEEEQGDERQGLLGSASSSAESEGALAEPSAAIELGGRTAWAQWRILFPTACQVTAQFLISSSTQQVTILFVGHLGVVELGAAALATMWVNITGLSIVYGGRSALDTLASQAYGAKNYQLAGLWSARFMAIVTLMCVPIAFAWWAACGPVLRAIGIDPVTAEAGEVFCRAYIPWMWPMFCAQTIQSWLRAQGVTRPVTVLIFLSLLLHIPTTWLFVEQLGFVGAPLALSVNAWVFLFMLVVYCKRNRQTRRCLPNVALCDPQLRTDWGVLLRLGGAGALSFMGSWWMWELIGGSAGMLGTVPLAAHAAMSQFSMVVFPFFVGGCFAATARVGNLLGAGEPELAIICSRGAIGGVMFQISVALFAVYMAR